MSNTIVKSEKDSLFSDNTINKTLLESKIQAGFDSEKGKGFIKISDGRIFHVNIVNGSNNHFSLNDSALKQLACRIAYLLVSSDPKVLGDNFQGAKIDSGGIHLKDKEIITHENAKTVPFYQYIQSLMTKKTQENPLTHSTGQETVENKQTKQVENEKAEVFLEDQTPIRPLSDKEKHQVNVLNEMLTTEKTFLRDTESFLDKKVQLEKLYPNDLHLQQVVLKTKIAINYIKNFEKKLNGIIDNKTLSLDEKILEISNLYNSILFSNYRKSMSEISVLSDVEKGSAKYVNKLDRSWEKLNHSLGKKINIKSDANIILLTQRPMRHFLFYKDLMKDTKKTVESFIKNSKELSILSDLVRYSKNENFSFTNLMDNPDTQLKEFLNNTTDMPDHIKSKLSAIKDFTLAELIKKHSFLPKDIEKKFDFFLKTTRNLTSQLADTNNQVAQQAKVSSIKTLYIEKGSREAAKEIFITIKNLNVEISQDYQKLNKINKQIQQNTVDISEANDKRAEILKNLGKKKQEILSYVDTFNQNDPIIKKLAQKSIQSILNKGKALIFKTQGQQLFQGLRRFNQAMGVKTHKIEDKREREAVLSSIGEELKNLTTVHSGFIDKAQQDPIFKQFMEENKTFKALLKESRETVDNYWHPGLGIKPALA